jgi:hypothetical protein
VVRIDVGDPHVDALPDRRPRVIGGRQVRRTDADDACAKMQLGVGDAAVGAVCSASFSKPNARISQSISARASVHRRAGKMLGRLSDSLRESW